MSMTYEELLNGLKNGEIKSPTIFENSAYICLRITGTGITERYKETDNGDVLLDDNEKPITYKINRSPEVFLSKTFLNACQGIPVLIEHPETDLLNSDNYNNHIIGTIVDTYVKDDVKEVWGIARVLDVNVVDLIKSGLKSTSPAVISNNIEVDGVLEEHDPYIDHLALVVDGYWDAYSQKAIQIDKNKMPKEDKMAEELEKKEQATEKEVEEKKVDETQEQLENTESSKIFEINDKIDKILSALTTEDTKDDSCKKDSEESIREEEGKQDLVLDDILGKLNALMEVVGKTLNTEKEAEKENDDDNDKLTSEDIMSKEEEEVTIEDEEEKTALIDSAYNLAIKHKEDGLQWCKGLQSDTKYSFIKKFIDRNKDFIDSKYKSLLNQKANKENYALFVDAMKSIEANVKSKSVEKAKVDSKKTQCVSDDGKTKRFINVW